MRTSLGPKVGEERDQSMNSIAPVSDGLGFVGPLISIFPYIVPRAVTLWQAAAPYSSQLFMLVGVLAILPAILGYTFWAYWVFRGKVGAHGYH